MFRCAGCLPRWIQVRATREIHLASFASRLLKATLYFDLHHNKVVGSSRNTLRTLGRSAQVGTISEFSVVPISELLSHCCGMDVGIESGTES